MNKRGQALIEFVLLLPILIFLIFAIIDFGRIVYTKNHLESKASDLISLIQEQDSYDEMVEAINKNNPYQIKLRLNYDDSGYLTIDLSGVVELITPGLNLILGNPYEIKITRVLPYE